MGRQVQDNSHYSDGKGRSIFGILIKRSWRPKNVFDWLFPNPKLVDLVLDTQAQITEQYLLFLQRALAKIGNTFRHLLIQHDMKGDNIELNSPKKKYIDRMKSIGEELAKNRLTEIINFLKH